MYLIHCVVPLSERSLRLSIEQSPSLPLDPSPFYLSKQRHFIYTQVKRKQIYTKPPLLNTNTKKMATEGVSGSYMWWHDLDNSHRRPWVERLRLVVDQLTSFKCFSGQCRKTDRMSWCGLGDSQTEMNALFVGWIPAFPEMWRLMRRRGLVSLRPSRYYYPFLGKKNPMVLCLSWKAIPSRSHSFMQPFLM